jgi:hypothetical protein
MQFPNDPHKYLRSLGLTIVLAIELYKFIKFVATQPPFQAARPAGKLVGGQDCPLHNGSDLSGESRLEKVSGIAAEPPVLPLFHGGAEAIFRGGRSR